MHCCASSAAKEEALIPWTRDPSGRLQSQQKSEFRRTTDLPCHATQIRQPLAPVRCGRVLSTSLNRLQGRTLVWSLRSGWTVAPIALLQLAAFPDGLLTNHRCQMPLRAMPLSVRFGSDSDVAARNREVRFTPVSGHRRPQRLCPKSCHEEETFAEQRARSASIVAMPVRWPGA